MQKVIFNWLLVLRCDNGADAKTLLMTLDRRSRRCQKNNGAICQCAFKTDPALAFKIDPFMT
jgi:hypothetical protein